jgi:hypothetical protein
MSLPWHLKIGPCWLATRLPLPYTADAAGWLKLPGDLHWYRRIARPCIVEAARQRR